MKINFDSQRMKINTGLTGCIIALILFMSAISFGAAASVDPSLLNINDEKTDSTIHAEVNSINLTYELEINPIINA